MMIIMLFHYYDYGVYYLYFIRFDLKYRKCMDIIIMMIIDDVEDML